MERFLNEREAAHVTGFSRYWLQKKRVTGGGPPFQKIGTSVRYPAPELVEWMNSWGVVANTSQQPRGPRKARPSDRDTTILRRRSGRGVRVMLIEGIATPERGRVEP